MAKIGLRHLVAAVGKYSDDNGKNITPEYSNGFIIGKAISADKDVKFNDNPLYADDEMAENEYSFDSGTLKLGVDDFGTTRLKAKEIQALLFGHKIIESESGEPDVIRKTGNDTPPFVGVGYFKTGVKNNIKYYEATWIYKVKFMPPGESAKGKEKSISWQTPSIEGTIYTVDVLDSAYEEIAEFTTADAAVSWLDSKAKISLQII